MPGRRLLPEAAFRGTPYDRPDLARRREVLRETLALLANGGRERLHALARDNLARWASARGPEDPALRVTVVPDDWGVAAARAIREAGRCFAVLNMANAFTPGGAYVEGTVAQEENMFRRTDCHESLSSAELDHELERYRPDMSVLISGLHGRVYLDVASARVCLRGPEVRTRPDLGYDLLPDDAVFPFYELRAAADDLRDGRTFDREGMARRIEAQLDTLREAGVRHAVLGAFGCGAFRNPASEVARLYRDALAADTRGLREVVFAVFAAGYGPDNFTPFAETFASWPRGA